jgi:hypothetical protein
MKEHEFTLILTAHPSEEQADKMHGTFNDGTITTIAGVPQIHFHCEAGSLEEASHQVPMSTNAECGINGLVR